METKETQEKEDVTLKVKDLIHEHISIEKYHLWADLILFVLVAYTYYVGNGELYTTLLKYVIFALILRYLLNNLTHYTNTDTKKTYYQFNSYVAIFALLILLNPLFQFNIYTETIVILGYTLFLSAVRYGYTVDNLITLLITKMIVANQIL